MQLNGPIVPGHDEHVGPDAPLSGAAPSGFGHSCAWAVSGGRIKNK
jgi:hypothetical protein